MKTLNTVAVSATKKVYIKQANDINLFYIVLTQICQNEEQVLHTKSFSTLRGAERLASALKARG